MALAEDPNLRRRERLPVIAILVLVALMTLVGGVLAAGSSPSSQIPVLVLEKGWFTAFDAPAAAARGVLADVGADAERKGRTLADTSGAFVYRDGAFTSLSSIPGAAFSTHVANNNRGQIAGFYSDVLPGPDGTVPPGRTHGFVRERRGITAFDVPDASFILVKGINDRGQVVGEYGGQDAVPGPDGMIPPGTIHGFVRDRGGVVTTFDVPFFRLHDVADINDRGQIVGYYDNADGSFGGFLRDKGGRFTKIDFPGASDTTVHGTNNRGQVVGGYLEGGVTPNPDGTLPPRVVHGFLWDAGRFTELDVPGSIWTQPFGINDRGEISGGYYDAAGKQHGFVLRKGKYTTIDVPRPIDEFSNGNIAWGINDRGEIVVPDPTIALLPVATS
jgi:uncharacterized membrane protein